MAINKVVYGDDVLVDLTPTTAEAEDVIEGKLFVNKNGILTQGTNEGGSKDYEELENKPSINNVELVGNKTTSDLGIVIPTVPTNLSSFTDDLGSNPTHTHSQYLTSETEPMFNSSVAKGITSSDITNWNNKSTFSGNYNDLTNKPNIPSQLSELSDDSSHRLVSDTEKSNWNNKSDFSGNYNDLTNKPNLFSGNYNDLTNKPDIPDSLSDLTDDSTHRVVTDTEKTTWNNKSNFSGNYNDLTNKPTLFSGDYNDLTNKPTIPTVPTNVSAFTNDSGYITNQANDLTNYSLTTNIQTNRNLTGGVEYIVGTQESATNRWTGVSIDTGCSNGTLYTGKTIIYHLPVAGTSSAATLNLTLPDETTTGNINIYRLANSTVTTTFASGCDILMVYDGTQWKVNAYVDSNTNTIGYQLRTNSGIFKNGSSTSIYRYQILVETPNGLEAFTSTSNSTKTTKTQLSPHYRPGGEIRYYGATGTVSSGANIGATSLWQQYAFDLRYSFNVTSTEFEIGDTIYIKMSKNGDGTLSPIYNVESAGHPLVTQLPTSEDGYVYLYLGQTYSAYQMELTPNHPMYEYKNGKIREYIEVSSGGGGGSATDVQVNGVSITSEGTANILTETTYSSSNKIATVSDLPTKTSDLTNDSNFISGLVMLTYGSSTWQDFQNAYNSNKIVYCQVGGRMAFLAYISSSNVEFQYYRSLSSPTVSSQVDEVYVYTLTNASVWTTTTRKASSTIDTSTGLSKSYATNTRTMTLSVDTTTIATKQYVDDTLGDIETLLGGI